MGVASPACARRGALGNIELARTASAPRREVVNTTSSRGRRRATLRKRLYSNRGCAVPVSGNDYSRRFVVADSLGDASVKRPAEYEGAELRQMRSKASRVKP
jgi:hypothetical protein